MSTEPTARRSTTTRWVLIGATVVIVVGLALTFWPRPAVTIGTLPTSTPSTFTTETPTPDPFVTPVPPKSTTTPEPSATFVPHARKPVPLSNTTSVISGLTVQITSVAAVQGTGRSIGDVNGPSIQVRMTVKNTTGKSVNLANVVVNAYYGTDHTPASALPSPGGQNFPATVASGGSAKGVFVFSIPKNQRSLVSITFDFSVKTSVVVFQGSAPV
jgi:hypothetical protein